MMDTIKVAKRDFTIKAKKLRRNGMVPGSVFGGSLKESVSLQINEAEARKLIANHFVGSRLNLDLEGKIIPVQLKEKSVNNLNNEIMDLSFQALKADQKVNSVINIVLTNTDKVTAILEEMTVEIPYAALPADMIDTIEIDVDGMGPGTVVTVADVKELQSDKLDVQLNPEEIIFRIVEAKKASDDDEEEAAE